MDTWELTEYEQVRTPQEVSRDCEMTVSRRSLYREIVCPVCLEMITQTRAAPDCFHRFCKRCVEKVVKKECPICRKKLPSQAKSFREDIRFDQLIARIRAEYQATRPTDNINRTVKPLECEVVLKTLDSTQTRYLKCPENTTIDHLAKYLAIRPENTKVPLLNNKEEYKLYHKVNAGQYEHLNGTLKLSEIKTKYMGVITNGPMELYFHIPR